jgi:ferredoxin
VTEVEERVIGDITIRVDRSVCVGFAHCIDEAAEAFLLGDENLVHFNNPEQVDRAGLIAACEACPVSALTVLTESGEQLVP